MAAKPGRPFKERPSRKELYRLYVKEERSVRDVAMQLNCSKDLIYRALKEYGVNLRPGISRSALRTFDLRFLKREVREKGYRQTARELKINEATLWAYLKDK